MHAALARLTANEKECLRRRPQLITFIAPVVAYVLVLASGTTHVIYALLPVIAEVSRKAGIRPERPLSISVIAGFQGVVASPISAATVAMVGLLADRDVSLPRMMAITIPSTFFAVLLGALSVSWRGAPLGEDPDYQKRLGGGELKPPAALPEIDAKQLFNARGSTFTFLAGVLLVVLIGMFPNLRPTYETLASGAVDYDQVSMSRAIMIVMLASAGLTTILFKASPETTLKGTMMRSGVSAIISIVGVAWLGSSFFEGNRQTIVSGISGVITGHPWAFAAGLFLLSSLLFSAAATVAILMPVGLALGMQSTWLIACFPAANGVFFLPTYGTLLAAVSFDQTGTTKIGKYLLNHSFMLPGLVTTVAAVVIALLIGKFFPV